MCWQVNDQTINYDNAYDKTGKSIENEETKMHDNDNDQTKKRDNNIDKTYSVLRVPDIIRPSYYV